MIALIHIYNSATFRSPSGHTHKLPSDEVLQAFGWCDWKSKNNPNDANLGLLRFVLAVFAPWHPLVFSSKHPHSSFQNLHADLDVHAVVVQ